MYIKEIKEEDRPREKLEKLGPSKLTDLELLAIIIKTGSRSLKKFYNTERVLISMWKTCECLR